MAHAKRMVGKQAIVIGASMAGLLAARVLSEHFGEVTVLERDTFPAASDHRKGVPQSRHAHAVLAGGLKIMEGYFPGLTASLMEQGADFGDMSEKARWYHEGAFHAVGICGDSAINVSRPLLESNIRARVQTLPNVRFVEGCDVLGLLSTADRGRVTGVRIIRRRADSVEESLQADLVVDAGGRGARSPQWLESLGYARPTESEVKVGLTYMSCQFERRPDDIPGIVAVIVAATPDNPRTGALLSQEGNRWIATVAGYLGDAAAPDHAGFLEFVRGMQTTAIYDVIRDATPITEPTHYKIPSNLRRHYEKLARFPAGYLVMGDAVCSFNPIYGQGMSVAAQESIELDRCLDDGDAHLAQRFFKAITPVVDVPWSTAVGNDLRIPGVEGPRTGMVKFINWYVGKLHHVAHHDTVVAHAFLRVVNLLAPPPSIMHPRIAWRVLWGNLVRRTPHPVPLPATRAQRP